jgi:two-component system phosphate regulon sensor histidine kinase PhoR
MSFRSRIRWRIAIPYVILILVAMAGFTIYFSNFLRESHVSDLRTRLTTQARLVGDGIRAPLENDAGIPEIAPVADKWGDLLDARVTIIGADGVVLGDSDEDPIVMENHVQRPEVQQALVDGQGSSVRFSRTLGYKMMYVAVPITGGGGLVGIARVALPLTQIESDVARLRWAVLVTGFFITVVAGLLTVFIAERLARPLRELTRLAERMAQGDLGGRIQHVSSDEAGRLADAFNQMGAELERQMAALADQRNTLTAVLNHMADGVIITDGEGRIELINPAAARILDLSSDRALGESFATVARHHAVIEIWQLCQSSGEEQSEMVEMLGQGPFLHVVGTPLKETLEGSAGRGGHVSCLMLLQDLTRVRRLETVRRDFMSNISHELRTPLAGLKALVDTLRGGALKDPPAARRFLDRMETEVDALTQMVQELLELSRIESGRVPLRLAPTAVVDVVGPPTERLGPQIERAKLKLKVVLPPHLPEVLADAERAREVVTNLVHNAIKFTPKRGKVRVKAVLEENHVVISVKDSGVGISAQDLPRIFERFYKADRARSGGGTGLGLAIAKHIVQGHGGRIWVESVEGQGSTFYFTLPTVD